MVNGIRASDICGLNKGCSLKLRVGSRFRQETPEEDRWTNRPKRCEYKNNNKDNCQDNLWESYVSNYSPSSFE